MLTMKRNGSDSFVTGSLLACLGIIFFLLSLMRASFVLTALSLLAVLIGLGMAIYHKAQERKETDKRRTFFITIYAISLAALLMGMVLVNNRLDGWDGFGVAIFGYIIAMIGAVLTISTTGAIIACKVAKKKGAD